MPLASLEHPNKIIKVKHITMYIHLLIFSFQMHKLTYVVGMDDA